MGPDLQADGQAPEAAPSRRAATVAAPAKAARRREASPTLSVDSTAASGCCSDAELEPLPEPAPSGRRGPAGRAREAPWEQIHERFAAALRRVAEQEDDDDEAWEDLEQGPHRRSAAPAIAGVRCARGCALVQESTAAWWEVSSRLAAALERATTEEGSLDDDEEWLRAPEPQNA